MNKFNSRRTYLSTYPLSGHYIHLDSLSLSLSLSLQSHAKKFLPGFGDGLAEVLRPNGKRNILWEITDYQELGRNVFKQL